MIVIRNYHREIRSAGWALRRFGSSEEVRTKLALSDIAYLYSRAAYGHALNHMYSYAVSLFITHCSVTP